MAVSKVVRKTINGEEVLVDLTDSTVTPETLAEGYVAYNAKGEKIVGTMTVEESIPEYWKTALEEGAEAINTALCKAGMNKSAFLFYTDAHWNYNSQMSPTLLKYLYKNTGITKTFFGGDIVNNEATDYDTMKYLWEWRRQLKDLPNHHSAVGNHDDGNATDNLFSEQYVYGYLLAPEETKDIVRDEGMYYYIDNTPEKTRYLFLDTAYKGFNSKQREFVNQSLMTTPSGWHIVAIAHIWHDTNWTDSSHPTVGGLNSGAKSILDMFDNYNSRSGDYADCKGWVEFCVGGHTHWDFTGSSTNGIPIILCETDSRHVRSGLSATKGTTSESSVNGIVADYDNRKIYVVRVGRGNSREVAMNNNTEITYTNVLPTALDVDGITIYSGKGYKENTRWSSSSNADSAKDGAFLTGYIPINSKDVVRLKNITLKAGTDSNATGMIILYRSLDDVDESCINGDNLINHNKAVVGDDGNINEITIDPYGATNYAYMRIQSPYIGSDSIITINEVIPDTSVGGYTNLADPTPTTDTTITTSSEGWLENVRINSSGAITTETNNHITNIIPVGSASVLRCKNMCINGGYGRIYLYNGTNYIYPITVSNNTGIFTSLSDTYAEVNLSELLTILKANKGNSSTFDSIRCSGTLIGTKEDVIITLDEEITEKDGAK